MIRVISGEGSEYIHPYTHQGGFSCPLRSMSVDERVVCMDW